MRTQIAAANWKMNLTLQQADTLLNELMSETYNLSDNRIMVLGVPFPYLLTTKDKIKNNPYIYVAAQNCSNKKSGAYTGETSVEMLKSIGVEYVIIGHSERREYYNEGNQLLAEKVNLALEYGIKPIFCCGEALQIREAGMQNEFVAEQIKQSLFHLSADQIQNVVIAYEPIWAIGTGKTATTEQAQKMHAHLRKTLKQQYGATVSDNISILYGGSVKANNAREIFSCEDVDGGLVGGASLVAKEFTEIVAALK